MNREQLLLYLNSNIEELNQSMKIGPNEDWITRVEASEVIAVLENVRDAVAQLDAPLPKPKLYLYCALCHKRTGDLPRHWRLHHYDKQGDH